MRLPVGHACLALDRVVQRQRVEVEKLLQLFELHHTFAFVWHPQHQRRVWSRPCHCRCLPAEPSLARALSLNPSLTTSLTSLPLLLGVGDVWACCFVEVHLPALFFFFTLSSLSVSPVFCESVPQTCTLKVIQVGLPAHAALHGAEESGEVFLWLKLHIKHIPLI